MGKLEVVFRIRLAYPGLFHCTTEVPAVVKCAETGNTVRIEPPRCGPVTGPPELEQFEQMTLRVERQCTDEQETDTSPDNLKRLGIGQDAARAFYQLFEAIRQAAFRLDNAVSIYPVVPSEDIRSNPLVTTCDLEWIYNGNCLKRTSLARGTPGIEIRDDLWVDAGNRLGEGRPFPVYRRFALDAFYFAEHDPPRGIIMACAAWETALRSYLAKATSKRDPEYLVASEQANIPTLYGLAKAARGGPLFYDRNDRASGLERASLEHYRKQIEDLPGKRNKLLHRGEADIATGVATDCALAVLKAIEWLFAEGES